MDALTQRFIIVTFPNNLLTHNNTSLSQTLTTSVQTSDSKLWQDSTHMHKG